MYRTNDASGNYQFFVLIYIFTYTSHGGYMLDRFVPVYDHRETKLCVNDKELNSLQVLQSIKQNGRIKLTHIHRCYFPIV